MGGFQVPIAIFQESVSKFYKISVQSWPSWTADWAKAQLLAIIIGTLLAWILYAVIRKSPRRWWLYFWIISLPLLLFGIFISPYVIDPLFNKYEPLSTKAPDLVPALQRITRRAGQQGSPRPRVRRLPSRSRFAHYHFWSRRRCHGQYFQPLSGTPGRYLQPRSYPRPCSRSGSGLRALLPDLRRNCSRRPCPQSRERIS